MPGRAAFHGDAAAKNGARDGAQVGYAPGGDLHGDAAVKVGARRTAGTEESAPRRRDRRLSKGARTRQRIVGHATLLMYANGYARTSIEDVIRAAGITKGSFYFHFSSKEDLGLAVIENASAYILGRLKEALESPGLSSWERLETMLGEIQRIVEAADCTRGCILGNLALETSHDHPAFREAIAAAFREWWELIASHLEGMREEGELPAGFDCRAYAQFAVSAMEGGIMMSKVTRDPEPMRTAVRLVLQQLEKERSAAGAETGEVDGASRGRRGTSGGRKASLKDASQRNSRGKAFEW